VQLFRIIAILQRVPTEVGTFTVHSFTMWVHTSKLLLYTDSFNVSQLVIKLRKSWAIIF